MKTLFASMLSVIILVGVALPIGATYYDIGKNGENKINVSWESSATLETIVGRSNKATGFVYIDDKGMANKVQITIPVRSMKTGIDGRDEHMAAANWLDADQFPNIEFKSVSIKKKAGKPEMYDITGDLTIHGKTKRITVTGMAKKFPARPNLEKMGYVGDIIQLKTTFQIMLSDFGVMVPEGMVGVKLANELSISFDIFAFTNHSPDRTPEGMPTSTSQPASQPAR